MKGLTEKLKKCFDDTNIFFKTVIIVAFFAVMFYVMNYFLKIRYFADVFFIVAGWVASYRVSENILPMEKDLHKKIISILIACSVILCWIFCKNWLTNNIIAVILFCYISLNIPRISMKLAITICVGLVIFDIIVVYYTDIMASVIGTAISNDTPNIINIPTVNKQIFIGLGDIFFPFFLVREEFYLSKIHNLPKIKKIPIAPMLLLFGHIIGIILSIFSMLYFQIMQPALIYIIPVMVMVLGINRLFLYKTRLVTV